MRTFPKLAPNLGSMKLRTEGGSDWPPAGVMGMGGGAVDPGRASDRQMVVFFVASSSALTGVEAVLASDIWTTLRAVCLASCSAGSLGWETRENWTETGADKDTKAGADGGATAFATAWAKRATGLSAAGGARWTGRPTGFADAEGRRNSDSERCTVPIFTDSLALMVAGFGGAKLEIRAHCTDTGVDTETNAFDAPERAEIAVRKLCTGWFAVAAISEREIVADGRRSAAAGF